MKGFFSSFRNAVISILCAVVVLVIAGIGIFYATEAKGKKSLDRNMALEYAMADAGVSESEITVTRQKLSQENGKSYYEIAFFTDSYEYEYEIDATNGAVLGMDIEALFGKPATSPDSMGTDDAGNLPPEGGMSGNGQASNPQAGGQQPEAPESSGGQEGTQSQHSHSSGTTGTSASPGAAGSSGTSGTGTSGTGSNGAYIGEDRAKEIAVGDAGVSLSEAVFTKSKLDRDDGIYVYDIEFYTSDMEYDYEIDAVSGTVLDKDAERFRTSGAAGSTGTSVSPGTSGTGASGTGSNGAYIGEDRAKEIAVGDAGVSLSEVVFTKSKLDRDDGIYVYDIEFYTSDMEYDYEIDAVSGTVLDKDAERFQTSGSSGTTGNDGSYIGEDRAKEIAAGHAGFQVSEVVFTKAKLEKEHDGSEYEIEFYGNGMEYEYCIDAYTGDILEYEWD